MTRGKKWLDVRAGFEGFTLIGDDAVTAEDFAILAVEIRRTLNPDAPAAPAVLAAVDDCEAAATTDAAADLLRKGFRLGQWLAVAERNRYFRGQLGINRKAGQSTKAKNLAARNEGLAKEYRKLSKRMNCLAVRKKLASDKGLTLKRVTAILRAEGVAIEQRKSE